MEPTLPLQTQDFGDNVSILANEDISLEPALPVQASDIRDIASMMTDEDILWEPTPPVQAREFVDHVSEPRESIRLELMLPRAWDFRDQLLEQRRNSLWIQKNYSVGYTM